METIRQQIALIDARFFAYHGYYPEEQVLGNEFMVDICVTFDKDGHARADDLRHTVNYEQLYDIAKTEMQQPRKLLETVADAMLNRIKADFPFVLIVQVSITKHNPPFGGDQAKAQVMLKWNRNSSGGVA